MFVSLSDFEGSLFDELRHMEREGERLFGRWPGPAEMLAVAGYLRIRPGSRQGSGECGR